MFIWVDRYLHSLQVSFPDLLPHFANPITRLQETFIPGILNKKDAVKISNLVGRRSFSKESEKIWILLFKTLVSLVTK